LDFEQVEEVLWRPALAAQQVSAEPTAEEQQERDAFAEPRVEEQQERDAFAEPRVEERLEREAFAEPKVVLARSTSSRPEEEPWHQVES